MSSGESKAVILSGDELLKLLKNGKDKWNDWVAKNRAVHIDFRGIDFVANNISLDGMNFPEGEINFRGIKFTEATAIFSGSKFLGRVIFNEAEFSGHAGFCGVQFYSDVHFCNAKFHNNTTFCETSFHANVNFSEAEFCGYIRFEYSKFGRKADFFKTKFIDAYFCDTQFYDGEVSFLEAQFKGYSNFQGVRFSGNKVAFHNTRFEKVDFTNTRFKGSAQFQCAQFEDNAIFFKAEFPDVDFYNTKFGDGKVVFDEAQFNGFINFNNARFANSDVSFYSSKFSDDAVFTNLIGVDKVKKFSFKYAAFNSVFDISSEEKFGCIVDLTGTKTTNHVDLSGLRCELQLEDGKPLGWLGRFFPNGYWTRRKIAVDKEDVARARRLKELAGANKDHDKALDFHAMEMRAACKHRCFFWFNLEFWYDLLSNYGRSIAKPFWWIIFVWLAFSLVYFCLSGMTWDLWYYYLGVAMVFSASQMLPFVPIGRNVMNEASEVLFSEYDLGGLLSLFTFFQSILAFVLLFLFGLGLRNRFKL
ncbi:MAG: pentapeptide repeat-containing protein [Rickettsiales bacterium]